MKHITQQPTKLSLLTALTVLGFLALVGVAWGPAMASQGSTLGVFSASSNPEVADKLALAKFNQKFLDAVEQKVRAVELHRILQEKIRDYPAEEKIALFLRMVESARVRGISMESVMGAARGDAKLATLAASGGSIEGAVTVNGTVAPPPASIEVMAFDTYGFPGGTAEANLISGAYTIENLAPGDYIVLTRSPFVDELYDDVVLAAFQNWRDFTAVSVTEGNATTGIDFDLAQGATVSGNVYEADGVTAIPFNLVNFAITAVDDPEVLLTPFAFTGFEGEYEFTIPGTGDFKVAADVDGYMPEYYNEKVDWDAADPVSIPDLSATISGIDFSLVPGQGGGPTVEGGVIRGTAYGPAGASKINFALVFAFDMADTSVAAFGITGLNLLDPFNSVEGEYELFGLDIGEYVVYADDYFGSRHGEYYDDADTPDAATVLTIASETDTLSGIDFSLPYGGSIAGTLTDDTGAALDSVLVVAVKADLENANAFFVESFDIAIGFSNSDGEYELTGLSDGEWILRTVALISENYAGQLLDEWYENVHDIFAIDEATPVTVTPPTRTAGIDFVLEAGGGIVGHFYETGTTTPVDGEGTVVAFDAETGLPALALSGYDAADGSYVLGPLADGDYVLLGIVGGGMVTYLPQFYDGAASPDEATPVSVTAPGVTTDIDFSMVRAGSLKGRVFAAAGFPVGADSLGGTAVIAYDAFTGKAAGAADITFAGGFEIDGLVPGSYKLQALTAAQGFAATYHGGGATFDDASSTALAVGAGEQVMADITLGRGEGIISGNVNSLDGSEPVAGVLVLVYDGTGHIASGGVSGMPGGSPSEYLAPGLAAGSYYVRTFNLFRLILLLEEVDLEDAGDDLLGVLIGMLAGANDLINDFEFELYADLWYDNQTLQVSFDPFELLFSLLLGGGELDGMIPMQSDVPFSATAVAVSSPGEVSGIDFYLPPVGSITDVAEPGDQVALPSTFELSQSYPNPFSLSMAPTVAVTYGLPQSARVSVAVYNALGQKIRTLVDGHVDAGSYQAIWDGRNARGETSASGIYFLQLKSGGTVLSRKLVLMR